MSQGEPGQIQIFNLTRTKIDLEVVYLGDFDNFLADVNGSDLAEFAELGA